jgi:hypothetical protein
MQLLSILKQRTLNELIIRKILKGRIQGNWRNLEKGVLAYYYEFYLMYPFMVIFQPNRYRYSG